MNIFFAHEIIDAQAGGPHADKVALKWRRGGEYTYAELAEKVTECSGRLRNIGITPHDRVAIYLPKLPEFVISVFGVSKADGIFVPINPVLKPKQVQHLLKDSGASVLITSSERLHAIENEFDLSKLALTAILLTNPSEQDLENPSRLPFHSDVPTLEELTPVRSARRVDTDLAALMYTSGSTGAPKGVALSHRNLIVGASSVSQYLHNNADDTILAILPFSFDAGLSQLTTGFISGATVYLLDYLLPQDVVKVVQEEGITGITAVPPLWMQLVAQNWHEAGEQVRYFANTGGKLPDETLQQLRGIFPNALPYLMYGLTEAFRSTFLDPSQIDIRPSSIGKAIPNADVLVVREDGSECDPDEIGELVHRGPLVAQGYWGDAARTAERFRPLTAIPPGNPRNESVVWSGDWVRRDSEGYLYFVGRKDDMIKTSGYRVSPTEIEEIAFSSGMVSECCALGVSHPNLGQSILLVAKASDREDTEALLSEFRKVAPAYMVPSEIRWAQALPRNANGKIDRKILAANISEHIESGDL